MRAAAPVGPTSATAASAALAADPAHLPAAPTAAATPHPPPLLPACFFLAALLCGLYYLFALPLPSSFHLGGRARTAVGAWAEQALLRCCLGGGGRALA